MFCLKVRQKPSRYCNYCNCRDQTVQTCRNNRVDLKPCTFRNGMRKLGAIPYRGRRTTSFGRAACPAERVEWSEKFLQLPDVAYGYMASSDESWFPLSGTCNPVIQRRWSVKEIKGGHGRPKELLHHQPLHNQKLMVFAGAEIIIMVSNKRVLTSE